MKVIRVEVGLLATNCWILYNEKGDVVVFDPGDDTDRIVEAVEKLDVPEKTVHAVVLTHGHFDHLGVANEVADELYSFIYMSKKEFEFISGEVGTGGHAFGMEAEVPIVDFKVEEGDAIEAGSIKLEVIETPGHSPGSMCLVARDGEEVLLFSGDTLFAGSIGRTDLDGGDEAHMTDSLERLAQYPSHAKVYPGHGPATTIGLEENRNPFWP